MTLSSTLCMPLTKLTMGRKTSSFDSSLATRHRLVLGVILSVLSIWGLWGSFSYNPSLLTNPLNCGRDEQGVNLRCDPPNPTFYDDPTLNFSIERHMEDWDYKRKQWLRYHPSFTVGLNERILVVTGSQPSPCHHPTGDHFMLRFFKNKVDYCRIHGYYIFYNNAFLHPQMNGYWAKPQLIKAAMLAHPETEWILWVDSDAAFTDMDFKIPLEKFKDYNMVINGRPELMKKSWLSLNSGVVLFRNSQWAMDFVEEWAKMGPQSPNFEEWGGILMATFEDKKDSHADDQSAMIYILLKQNEKWMDKIYFLNDYAFNGYWLQIVGRLDNITLEYRNLETRVRRLRRKHAEMVSEYYGELWAPYVKSAGYNDDGWRRPFITHFTGCQPCNGKHNPAYEGDSCWEGMKRALNFADNQVLRNYGFVHPDLFNSSISHLKSHFSTEN